MRKKTVMNVLLCFMLLLTSLSASAQGKKVTISAKDMALTTALRQVEQQSGYYKINYPSAEVSRYKVTANVKNETAPEAVKILLKGLPFESAVNGQFIQIKQSFRAASNDQRKAVRGKLLDADGEPLIGATVMVEGTNIGTVTDVNGNYVLEGVDESQVLTYSYIGKRSMQRKAGSKNAVIILEDENALLDDVVVTGYQTISKERTAGSYNIIKGDDIANKAVTSNSIVGALEGMTTGLQVNNDYRADRFTIRGITSINSTRSPLFVVDGVPLDADLVEDMVNSNDIQSITVLKDATAASIWGSQAANGVVVIQTKKGQQAQRVKVSYNGSFSFYGKPDYSYYNYMDNRTWMKNAQELFDIYSDSFNYSQVQTGTTGITDNAIYKRGEGAVIWPHELAMYQAKMGIISPTERDNILEKLIAQNGREQYEKYFMSDQLYTQHNISLQGGTKKSTFYVSANYKGDQGTAKDWTNRVTLNGYHDYKITDWMKWDVTLNVSLGNTNGHVNPFDDSNFNYYTNNQYFDVPYNIFRDANGWIDQTPMVLTDEVRRNAEEITGIDLTYYPVDDYNSSSDKTTNSNIRINTGLTLDLFKGLRYEGRFQYSRINSRRERFRPSETFSVREERAGTFNIGGSDPTDPYGLRVPRTGGHYVLNNGITSDWTLRNQLSYDASLGDGNHQITALAGTEVRAYKTTNYGTYLRGYNMQTMESEAYNNYLFRTFRLPTPAIGTNASGRYWEHDQTEATRKYFSLYANAAYTYLSKYTLNASIRMDQSNLFGSDPSTQYKPIWSVGAAWKLNSENWMQGTQSWLNNLTLRFSYGLAGNSPNPDAGGRYDILTTDNNAVFESPGFQIATPANDMLTWEKTRTINVGLDMALLRNRIRLSLDYYDKYTTDLIGTMMLNPTTGWLSTTGNVAEMSNHGLELSLNTHNIQSRDFNWHTMLTLSSNSNKIEKMQVEQPISTASDMMSYAYHEGYPMGAMFSYRYAGLNENGNPKVYNKNGEEFTGVYATYELDKDDVVYSGTTIPKIYGGLTNRLSYKNLELSFMFAYNLGHKMRKPSQSYRGRLATNLIQEFDHRWRQPGDELTTDIPRYTVTSNDADYSMFYSFYSYGDKNVIDASYIKLRDISLSWNLPHNWCRKIYTENIRLTAQVGNLFLIAFNNEGIDPEAYYLAGGVRQAKMKPSLSFGINVNF